MISLYVLTSCRKGAGRLVEGGPIRNDTQSSGQTHRPRWWNIVSGTALSLVSDRGSMAAAGCAFYATLALFPAISTLVSIYGLAFDRETIEQQLRLLHGLLPGAAYNLISGRVHDLVTQPSSQLGLKLIVSFLVTFWSANTGTKSLLSALNVAYDVNEERSFLVFQGVTLGLTLSAIIVVVLGIAVLVFVPVVVNDIGLGADSAPLIHAVGLTMLVLFAALSIFVLYRVGPARKHRTRQRLLPGVFTATVLWLAASAGLNFYIANLTNLGATYGSIAAVIGIMLWFYLTAYAVLVGAELNAQLEGPLPGRG